MVFNINGDLGAWQRTVENYTVGFVIAAILLAKAKRQQRRQAHMPG